MLTISSSHSCSWWILCFKAFEMLELFAATVNLINSCFSCCWLTYMDSLCSLPSSLLLYSLFNDLTFYVNESWFIEVIISNSISHLFVSIFLMPIILGLSRSMDSNFGFPWQRRSLESQNRKPWFMVSWSRNICQGCQPRGQ